MGKEKQQDASQGTDDNTSEKKGFFSSRKRLLILSAAILTVAAVITGAFLFFNMSGSGDNQDKKKEDTELTEKQKDIKEDKDSGYPFEHLYIIPSMEIVLKDETLKDKTLKDKNRSISIGFGFEMDRPELKEELNDRKEMIHGAIRTVVASKSLSELETAEGKIRLKLSVTAELNRKLETGKIRNIYFTDFFIM